MADDEKLTETRDRDGRTVVLLVRTWAHILDGHPEMLDHLGSVMETIADPEHREPDPRPGRERYFRRGGPERWIRVVAEFAGRRDRVVTRLCAVQRPGGVARMTVRIGRHEFDHASYDEDADVLYLRRGRERKAATTFGTPEGHAVRLDEDGDVIGMTLVNARWLIERDGHLVVTVPERIESSAEDLAPALEAS